jgi:hypothetical protein
MNRPPLRHLSLALGLAAFDAAWAWQALHAGGPHAVSNVALVSLVLWSYFHLPAALAASWLAGWLGWLPQGAGPLPAAALWLTGALGLAQTFLLTLLILRWLRRSPA